MPYAIKRRGAKWVVYNRSTGDEKGTHDTRKMAMRQVNLLRGIKHGWKPTGAPARK